ncbi:MAG: S8 family serine peptidase [Phycisphaeraceae bacterium]|nr:S8 family serine peptidase [Phycisphaeraceae bacterium]
MSQNPDSPNARHGSSWRSRTLAAALLACAGAASTVSAQVQWKAAVDDTFKVMSRAELASNAADIARKADSTRVVVSFDRPLLDSEKDALRAAGLRLHTFVGANSWIGTLEGGANANAIASRPALVNIREMSPAWKLHSTLAQGTPPEWTILDHIAAAEPAELADPADGKRDHLVAAYVAFHADIDIHDAGAAVLNAEGVEIRSFVKPINTVVVHAHLSQIRELAQRDEVMWIEPAEPTWTPLNNSNRERTQVNAVNAAPYGLTGAGVNVMVYDGGRIRNTHQTFRGDGASRAILGVNDNSSTSDHATHVAGTVAGRGDLSGNHRGMAPDALITSFGFQVPGGLQAGFLYTDPGDLVQDYTAAIQVHGAHLSNNSIGSNTAPNGFPCDWEGDYGLTSALIDEIARGSLGRNMIMIWAAGNERQGTARCGSTYRTTAPPGNAKNHITVGALNSNDDSVTGFTSWGPDDSGRMRPDISAPGCQNGVDPWGNPSDNGVTSSGSSADTTFNTKCGTSMAAPTVAGAVALILQDWRLNFSGEPDPDPSMVKVLLAHNAQDVAQPGPDNQTGYGSIRVKDTIDFMREGNIASESVSQGGSYSVLVFVEPGSPEFKATLAWDDAPGAAVALPMLVNDLDLVVIDPNGNRQYPWTLDFANPGANAVRNQPNTKDNIEQVFVANPTPGVWQVNIVGTNVPVGPQTFSLAASPLLINCSTAGLASLNSAVYQCGAELSLRVSDCDLNMDDGVNETVIVHVTSTSDPIGEMVVLTETGPLTADFRAMLPTSSVKSPGVLRTLDGDTITLTYIDADDGFGGTNVTVTATATVDCAPPVISNVAVASTGPFGATITFETSEPAVVTMSYGTACGGSTTAASPRNTTHSVSLSGLTDGTAYFFSLAATDDAGNASTNNNEGACFSFSTTDIPSYFAQQFTTALGLSDLQNLRLAFEPSPGNIDFYTGCAEEISSFDTNPEGGTPLALLTSNSIQVTLADNAKVRLYGVEYSSFWVNAAGNITFNGPDSTTVETFAIHFNQPRISPFFDGLNSGAGQVSWKQFSDRAAVTWINIQDNFSPAGPMTFQVVMFFDGRIELNYLTNNGRDGIAGLSPGGGTPVGFAAIDLSAMSDCGPRPPFAGNTAFSTPANTEVVVQLPVNDDGLPGDGLSYFVQSLPANGRLFDSANGLITAVPYQLTTDTLTYRPNFNYLGNDSFTYMADDGGTPPEGGPSNLATISFTVGGPTPVYEFNFDTDPGWTTQGQWAFGQPTGQGSRGRDPTSGYTGQFVYGYNLNGDYTNSMPAYNLTSTALDCSNYSGVSVSFWRWLGVESSTYDKARFEVSNNGTTWNILWANPTTSLNETAWTQHTYDISSIADGQSTVYLRWVMGTTDTSVIYHGWNIDDVVVSAIVPLPSCTGDANGDGVVNFADLNVVLSNFGATGFGVPGDLNNDDVVNFADLNVVLSNFGVGCNDR